MPAVERSSLHVEGNDDGHVIRHLLHRHGIDCPMRGMHMAAHGSTTSAPEIKAAGDVQNVLDAIRPAVSVSNGRAVGFVLDADMMPQNRWDAVCDRLQGFGLELPSKIPNEGFVDDIPAFKARVGVWIMPDNRNSGALEQFLQSLVDQQDTLLPLAETATANAKKKGARFSDAKLRKAVLHTWLAWQEEPGLRYGTAIGARYFRHDPPTAQAFVAWYRSVFDGI